MLIIVKEYINIMSQEVLTIRTDKYTIYKQYLTLKKPFIEGGLSVLYNKHITLNPKLLDVFSILLFYNNKFKDIEDEKRSKLLLSQPIRNEILSTLNITQPQLNTYISTLRKYQLLIGNKINDRFAIYPNGSHELVFKLYIKEDEK